MPRKRGGVIDGRKGAAIQAAALAMQAAALSLPANVTPWVMFVLAGIQAAAAVYSKPLTEARS